MDEGLEEMEDGLKHSQSNVVETFNNVLATLLARMTKEQMKEAIGNKSDTLLSNIFISAHKREQYEVCQVIMEELDKRKVLSSLL